MSDEVAQRMGLPEGWRLTAEGRAAAIARALEVFAERPHDLDATHLLFVAGAHILPFTRMREVAAGLMARAPDSVAAAVLVARVAGLLGGLDAALARLEAVTAAHPEHPSGWLMLSGCRAGGGVRQRDLAAADAALARAHATGLQDEVGLAIGEALILMQKRKAARAVELLRPLAAGSPAAQIALSDALAALGEFGAADAALAEALRMVPEWPYALVRLSLLRLRQARKAEALAAAQAALDSGGPSVDGYWAYGAACLASGYTGQALKALEYELQLRPEEPHAWVRLSAARGVAGDRAGARAARLRAAELAAKPDEEAASRFGKRLGIWLSAFGMRLGATDQRRARLGAAAMTVLLLTVYLVGIAVLSGGGPWWLGTVLTAPLVVLGIVLLRGAFRTQVYGPMWRIGAVVAGTTPLITNTGIAVLRIGHGGRVPASIASDALPFLFYLGAFGVILMLVEIVRRQRV